MLTNVRQVELLVCYRCFDVIDRRIDGRGRQADSWFIWPLAYIILCRPLCQSYVWDFCGGNDGVVFCFALVHGDASWRTW